MEKQTPHKRQVLGSSPSRPTKPYPKTRNKDGGIDYCDDVLWVNLEDRKNPLDVRHYCGLAKGHKLPPDLEGWPHECFCSFKREWIVPQQRKET